MPITNTYKFRAYRKLQAELEQFANNVQSELLSTLLHDAACAVAKLTELVAQKEVLLRNRIIAHYSILKNWATSVIALPGHHDFTSCSDAHPINWATSCARCLAYAINRTQAKTPPITLPDYLVSNKPQKASTFINRSA